MTEEVEDRNPEAQIVLQVLGKENAAQGVALIRLGHAQGENLPAWDAGAHIEVQLGPDVVRQYSLCGDVDDHSTFVIAVLNEPLSRGGSRFIHERLAVCDRLVVRGPRNRFRLVDADHYVFIAGGIGVTPILPMVRSATQRGKQWSLFYGGRTRGSMAFLEELDAVKDTGSISIWPLDETGPIDLASALESLDPSSGAIYCCGPEGLLTAVETACHERGLRKLLHTERFRPRLLEDDHKGEFEVELARTEVVLTVAESESILDAAERVGISVLSSCREGTCGTCEVTVIDGQPDHRDSVLDDEERAASETMMICVSRSLGPRLVLDL